MVFLQLELQSKKQHIKRIQLLLTYRQIYSEGINILYSQHTINLQPHTFEHFNTLAEIQNVLPTQRFRAIRSMEISFSQSAPYFQDLRDALVPTLESDVGGDCDHEDC
ncbi:hypothetical protein ASPWEDRAFT_35854 [Aspergillus wentii DTO 134E9]|uniref:DUF7730 domain-containing protein n=1 Tax=Aspergillus wentii DTO 134E9 TaxID=1073089 RepID=A0A1L9RTU8_ASPWE|nr:uncharacterized protein ASPWEDRAFT_35854 [Aspergillus wentii DTO 134E9]OJJ38237.1 hypothetical protein ASPWEDRAFT_35854 [Aspergillus wentii DTO 134E9]